jgi:hypothetical protein
MPFNSQKMSAVPLVVTVPQAAGGVSVQPSTVLTRLLESILRLLAPLFY